MFTVDVKQHNNNNNKDPLSIVVIRSAGFTKERLEVIMKDCVQSDQSQCGKDFRLQPEMNTDP